MNKHQIITNAREALEVLNPANYSDPDDVGGYVKDSLDMITKAIRDLLSLVDSQEQPILTNKEVSCSSVAACDYMAENERLRGIIDIILQHATHQPLIDNIKKALTKKEGGI